MLSTGYNCRDLLNIGLMRPIFSPTEYIQIKGRGTRLYTFKIGNTEYEKKNFFLLDFCAVAEYFEEKYDYSLPLNLPREKTEAEAQVAGRRPARRECLMATRHQVHQRRHAIRRFPIWEGMDTLVSREVIEVGPDGEKVDVMTFRGSFERDVKEFAERDSEMKTAVADEDDDAVETIMNERFYHNPEMYYSTDKLIRSYGVPAPTPAFVYNAVGKKPLPTKEDYCRRYSRFHRGAVQSSLQEQKWLDATAQLIADDPQALTQIRCWRYDRLQRQPVQSARRHFSASRVRRAGRSV